ncbi:DUF2752 domain-containing protein [Nocardioides speluncae]|uniref:DUF2752 domain-containing protein n=1 Tax=Nocardioides speluncae TaxID=2670337 RepID=UPI0019804E9B|nr:DUF2752 domain-containing protein [Nocardioides speluncae]
MTLPRATATPADRWTRVRGPVLGAAVAAGLTVALHFRDPHESGSWGFCPSAAMGVYCPGCGGLRAVNDLTNLDFAAAASSNLLFIALIPLILGLWVRRLVVGWRGGGPMQPTRVHWWLGAGLIGVAVVFTVLRNLPGSWLAP